MRFALPADDAVWQSAVVRPLIQPLGEQLAQFAPDQNFALACSGGRDSLLLALLLQHQLKHRGHGQQLRLLHVDHGLQPQSSQWAQQLQRWAQQQGLACQVLSVQVSPQGNLERAARQARYAALETALQQDEVLVLAHHQLDQAETVLMRLRQGAGTRGLAAMTARGVWRSHQRWRPWLDCDRAQITAAAEALDLSWVDDPANVDSRFDRVWLRQTLAPVLAARWPDWARGAAQTALWMQDAEQVFAEVLRGLRQQLLRSDGALDWTQLAQQSCAMQRLMLRDWLQDREQHPPPRRAVLALQDWILHPPREDAQPCLHWQTQAGRVEVRRYRSHLFRLVPDTASPVVLTVSLQDAGTLQTALGQLQYRRYPVTPLEPVLPWVVLLRPLQAGERVHLQGRVGHWPVKKWLQQQGIPPWQRRQIQVLCAPEAHHVVWAVLAPTGPQWTVAGQQLQQAAQWDWQMKGTQTWEKT